MKFGKAGHKMIVAASDLPAIQTVPIVTAARSGMSYLCLPRKDQFYAECT